MTLIPINLDMLTKKMTGKTGIIEVQGEGKTFFRNNKTVLSVTHLSDSEPGIYEVGDKTPRNGEYNISILMMAEADMENMLDVPAAVLRHLYKTLNAHRSAAGVDAKEVTIDICPHSQDSQMVVMKVFCPGSLGRFPDFKMDYSLNGNDNRHQVTFRMPTNDLLIALYAINACKKMKDAELLYQHDQANDPHGLPNSNPFFVRWSAYDREFVLGMQLVSDNEDMPMEVIPLIQPAVPGAHGDAFLSEDDLRVDDDIMPAKSKSKVIDWPIDAAEREDMAMGLKEVDASEIKSKPKRGKK